MEFVAGDLVRMGFGFFNPNHAAAAICALFPFCWGWRGRWHWAGRLIGAALCVMLAMTYSRTGFVVLVIEAAVLWWRGALGSAHPTSVRGRRWNAVPTLSITLPVLAVAAWWMWPRLALDGAVMNRPKIWFAGLQLFAANPMGVGFGRSGEIATAFMLPDGIAVRTLVNSHLTLLAEMGAFVGGAWLVFIALALCVGRKLCRTWVAFAGLVFSAFSASVFDWHVLFDFAEKGGCGAVNFVLAWGLFAAFVVMGVAMIGAGVFGNNINNLGQHVMERGLTSPRRIVVRAGMVCASVLVALVASVLLARRDATPKVEGEYVVCGRRWNAVPTGLCVYRDEGWSLKSAAKRFPDGARFCIRPGVPEDVVDSGEVWLFGDAAEAAWRFPAARLTLVSPPEFFDPPTNAVVVAECFLDRINMINRIMFLSAEGRYNQQQIASPDCGLIVRSCEALARTSTVGVLLIMFR